MSTTVTLDSSDLKKLANALEVLGETRVNEGVEVDRVRLGDDAFELEWHDDEGEYVIGSVS